MAEQASRRVRSRRPGAASRRSRDERGAGLVEFALLLPLFLSLAFGVLTGGTAYNRKLAITTAAREGARYGATLPSSTPVGTLLAQVADVTESSGSGELDDGTAGRLICVAFVSSTGAASKLTRTTSDASGSGTCFSDGRTDSRVQVRVERTAEFNVFFFHPTVTLSGRSVARYEDFG